MSKLKSSFHSLFNTSQEEPPNSLKKRVEKKRKSIAEENLSLFDRIKAPSWYRPSWQLNIYIFLGLLVSGFISHFTFLFITNRFDFPGLTFATSTAPLIAVHAGIGTIILALLIFVAESKRSNENPMVARALLKEAKLYPLTVAELTVFIGYAIGVNRFASLIPVIIIGSATIYSLHKTLQLLLNEFLFHQKQKKVFEDRAKSSMNLAIDERLGINELRTLLDQEVSGKKENEDGDRKSSKNENPDKEEEHIKLAWKPISPTNEDKFYWFTCDGAGTVNDINIKALKAFANKVEELANENGYYWFNGGLREEREEAEWAPSTEESTKEREDKDISRHRYLLTTLYEEINNNNREVLCIDKELIEKDEVEELQKLVNPIFTLRNAPTFDKEMRTELRDIKDLTLNAIEVGKTGQFKQMKGFYLNFTKTFLLSMEPFLEGGFSFSQAREERRRIGGGWEPVRWISYDVKDIYQKGKLATSKSVLSKALDFPIAIARQSIRYYDHYLFQTFIPYARFIYNDGLERNDTLGSFMRKKSWRKLSDLVEYVISHKLNKESIENEKKIILKDYAIFIYKQWQELLKLALKNDKSDDFDRMLSRLSRWFQYFQPSTSPQNAQTLRLRLKKEELEPETREDLRKQLKSQETLEEIEDELKNRKNQMLFGFASWVLDKILRNDEDFKLGEYFNKLMNYLPSDLPDLTELYHSVNNHNVISFWGWDRWVLPADGQAHFLNFTGKLRKLYILKSLKILKTMSQKDFNKLDLPYDRDFAIEAEEEGKLMKQVEKIGSDPSKWDQVLSEDELDQLARFRKLLAEVRKSYHQKEKRKKREANITQEKVAQFRIDFIESFKDSTNIRSLLKEDFELFSDESKKLDQNFNEKRFGQKTVEEKGAFIDNWHIDYPSGGRDHGRNMARSEDKYILDKILKNSVPAQKKKLTKVLTKFKQLEEVFILASSNAIGDILFEDENFTPEWSLDETNYQTESFQGYYRFHETDIPVFRANFSDVESDAVVLNAANFGGLVQYSPLFEGENPELVKDFFYVNVRAYSEEPELLENTLDNPPDWLTDKGNREDQKEYLKENVLVEIFERFELTLNEDFRAFKLELTGKS